MANDKWKPKRGEGNRKGLLPFWLKLCRIDGKEALAGSGIKRVTIITEQPWLGGHETDIGAEHFTDPLHWQHRVALLDHHFGSIVLLFFGAVSGGISPGRGWAEIFDILRPRTLVLVVSRRVKDT